MKKYAMVAISAALTSACILCAAGCGSTGSGTRIDFVYGGTTEFLTVMRTIVNAYNDGQGKADGITVRPQPYNAADLGTQVASALSDPNGADVLMLNDQFFKASAQYGLADLTGLFSDELLADMYPTHLERYYYDIDTNTSDTDDPLLGMPLNNDSTVLYYNRSALESINVKCISVEEDELDAFNAGGGGWQPQANTYIVVF